MTQWRMKAAGGTVLFALLSAMLVQQAFALDVEGITVGLQPTLITSGNTVIPGSVQTPAVFKVRIRVNTKGRVLLLCLGTPNDFTARNCPQPVAESSTDESGQVRDGLGFVDTAQLNGKVLYIKNQTSGAPANDIVSFTLTVE